jgi:hypothetical protein
MISPAVPGEPERDVAIRSRRAAGSGGSPGNASTAFSADLGNGCGVGRPCAQERFARLSTDKGSTPPDLALAWCDQLNLTRLIRAVEMLLLVYSEAPSCSPLAHQR